MNCSALEILNRIYKECIKYFFSISHVFGFTPFRKFPTTIKLSYFLMFLFLKARGRKCPMLMLIIQLGDFSYTCLQ